MIEIFRAIWVILFSYLFLDWGKRKWRKTRKESEPYVKVTSKSKAGLLKKVESLAENGKKRGSREKIVSVSIFFTNEFFCGKYGIIGSNT